MLCGVLSAGAHCELDFDACRDKPCPDSVICVDLPVDEHKRLNRGFNCTDCRDGFRARAGKCVGQSQTNTLSNTRVISC